MEGWYKCFVAIRDSVVLFTPTPNSSVALGPTGSEEPSQHSGRLLFDPMHEAGEQTRADADMKQSGPFGGGRTGRRNTHQRVKLNGRV